MSRTEHIEEILEGIQAVRRKMAQNKPKNSHMTPSEWMVISCLKHGKSLTVKEIAAKLEFSSSAATQLIDGLAHEGLITREHDEKDRRTVRVGLSKESEQRIKEYKRQIVANFTTIFDALSDTELEHLSKLYQKIATKIT